MQVQFCLYRYFDFFFIGDRPYVTNIMVVMTDGVSNDNELYEAEMTKAADIVIFSVGIGNNLDLDMLNTIANDPSYFLQTEYSQLGIALSAFIESKVPCAWCKDPSLYKYS